MYEMFMQTMEQGDVDLMEYVYTMLREQDLLKDIAGLVGITTPMTIETMDDKGTKIKF
jgi:hypothetical protein